MTIHELNRDNWPQTLPELAAGEVIRHLRTDEATIYNMVRSTYPNVQLVPIAPGTGLYSLTGAGCTYINAV